MAIEVKQVLHMNQGTDDTSYAKASYIQKQVLMLTRSIKEEAIKELISRQHSLPGTLCIADLGCSSAELNNFRVMYELMSTAEVARLGRGPMDYQIYLNDLPNNDFNTVFGSLAKFEKMLKQGMGDGFGKCFVCGVPGSFYARLFPDNSLHFIHSSYSLMWLSKVPEGIEDNNRNIYVAKTSPQHVVKAYYKQFQNDFSSFLQCRSKEVVLGGRMVLTILGRKTYEPYSKESCYMWELLAIALNDMVVEGIIEEEKLNMFNIPQYLPSAKEIDYLVKKEQSFTIDHIHVSQVSWEGDNENNKDWYDFAMCMRSVAEPLLISHFGEAFINEIFKRFNNHIYTSMAREKNAFINITIVMTKSI